MNKKSVLDKTKKLYKYGACGNAININKKHLIHIGANQETPLKMFTRGDEIIIKVDYSENTPPENFLIKKDLNITFRPEFSKEWDQNEFINALKIFCEEHMVECDINYREIIVSEESEYI